MRWSPYKRKNEVEIESGDKEAHIYFSYPDISDVANPTYLYVDLMHVRASDGFRVYYHGPRDGWVIEQASVFEWDCDDPDCDPKWKEVAFVQSWALEEEECDEG